MTLQSNWQEIEAAADKYGIEKASLLEWIEEGIIRSEVGSDLICRVNIDDLDLKIHELTGL